MCTCNNGCNSCSGICLPKGPKGDSGTALIHSGAHTTNFEVLMPTISNDLEGASFGVWFTPSAFTGSSFDLSFLQFTIPTTTKYELVFQFATTGEDGAEQLDIRPTINTVAVTPTPSTEHFVYAEMGRHTSLTTNNFVHTFLIDATAGDVIDMEFLIPTLSYAGFESMSLIVKRVS